MNRQFVVKRPVHIGLKDFQIETQSRIDERGNAIIELEMTNLGDEVANFRMHAPSTESSS